MSVAFCQIATQEGISALPFARQPLTQQNSHRLSRMRQKTWSRNPTEPFKLSRKILCMIRISNRSDRKCLNGSLATLIYSKSDPGCRGVGRRHRACSADGGGHGGEAEGLRRLREGV